MSSNTNDFRTLPVSAAVTRYRLLKQNSSNQWAHAGAGDLVDAICQQDVDATMAAATPIYEVSGEMLRPGCTRLLTASLAITAGDDVYPAASGKITNLPTGYRIGVAREAATADGDIIEIELRPDLSVFFAKITAPSTAIAATAADTAYDKTIAIGAGVLRSGSRGRIRAKAVASATTGAETMVFKVKIFDGTNTVTLAVSAAVDVANADQGVIDVEFDLPDATHIQSSALAGIGAATGSVSVTGIPTSTFAPTAASTISVTQTSSSTGETSTLTMLSVEIRR